MKNRRRRARNDFLCVKEKMIDFYSPDCIIKTPFPQSSTFILLASGYCRDNVFILTLGSSDMRKKTEKYSGKKQSVVLLD